MMKKQYQIEPIGTVLSSMETFTFSLKLDENVRPALHELAQFSHALVFWWADKHDNKEDRTKMVVDLPYAKNTRAGVFACRSEARPNPIAVTACKLLLVDEKSGTVGLEYIDAHDGTPIVDIKPYVPISDRIKETKVASWMKEWPDYFEEAADFFSNAEWE